MNIIKRSTLLPVLIISAFCSVLQPLVSSAIPGDEHWDVRFGAPGVTNNILALAMKNGVIYAGGTSSSINGTNSPLYLFDGAQWSIPATFFGPANSAQISDLAYVGNLLYAAGTFTNINGVTFSGLAKWDGTSWSSFGFSGNAIALAVDGNNLYVGGNFVNPGGVLATNIGYWDGSAWHALGNGLGVGNSSVHAITVKNGVVYAGGLFTNSGAIIATNIASWNGSIWSAVGGGVPGEIVSLVFNGPNLYATGFFSQAGATPASNIAMWDGANWNALSTGLNSIGESLGILNGSVCVAGSFISAGGIHATNFAVWNGSSWSAASLGLSSTGARVISNGTNVYVGGLFALAGGILANGVATWDGNNWAPIQTTGRMNGVQTTVFALANDGTNLYAGGQFVAAGAATNAYYVAKFDGTNWSPLGTGMTPHTPTTSVLSLTVASNNVYAGGSFSFANNVFAPDIARWDGTNWNALGTGPGGVVASVTVRTNGVYAAGAAFNSGNGTYSSPFLDLWNGSSWQGVLNFNSSNTFIAFYLSDPNIGMDAVAFMGTNIFVGGHFSITQYDPAVGFTPATNCPNIMRFDGTYCEIMGTGLNSNVLAMAVLGTNLYVGGFFTNSGPLIVNHIALWNGSAWSPVGTGVVGTGFVSALTTIGNNLYAGGTFTNMGGVAANCIAKWDGTNWSALGSGVAGRPLNVESLYAFGSDLYVGGVFRFAGGKSSFNIARWNDQINLNVPQLINPAWLSSGQFKTRLFGVTGQTNIIMASTNLTSWTSVLTNTAGIYDFTDPASSGLPLRFYRALLGP
jgi:hypothetical protein